MGGLSIFITQNSEPQRNKKNILLSILSYFLQLLKLEGKLYACSSLTTTVNLFCQTYSQNIHFVIQLGQLQTSRLRKERQFMNTSLTFWGGVQLFVFFQTIN